MGENVTFSEYNLLKRGLQETQSKKVISGLIRVKERISRLEKSGGREEDEGKEGRIPSNGEKDESGEGKQELKAILCRLDTIEEELKLIISSTGRQTFILPESESLQHEMIQDSPNSIPPPTSIIASTSVVPRLENDTLSTISLQPSYRAKGKILDENLKMILAKKELNSILEELRDEHFHLERQLTTNRNNSSNELTILETRLNAKKSQIQRMKAAVNALPNLESSQKEKVCKDKEPGRKSKAKLSEAVPKWRSYVGKNKVVST